mgnify:CR=1 FL=1
MKIKILDRFGKPQSNEKSTIFLTWDNWNDFSFYTLFGLYYVDDYSNIYDVGAIKIGYFGQEKGAQNKKLSVGEELEKLNDNYFSLGQSDMYYSILNDLGSDVSNAILTTLKDIAFDKGLYAKAINEEVTKTSLFRSISPSTVEGQFTRILATGIRLTEYNFNFFAPKIKNNSPGFNLSFMIKPESSPPTNIHVVIGRNGVGKTHLTNNMINSLIKEESEVNGTFEFIEDDEDENEFANLISISFSAFDDAEPLPEKMDKTKGIQYSYIGLKKIQTKKNIPSGTKSTSLLKNEFFQSLNYCRSSMKSRWKNGIEMLESDPNFKNADIKYLIDIEDDIEFKANAYKIFDRLSSGHRVVLLTITRLIEKLQEKSLVLIDEPEAHLHPPLLSAFIRALSQLLIVTNGVSIIATHSPVILQEVPNSCAWKLRRIGAEAIAERLNIETFGENVGVLTNEVFGLEVTNSGFYKLIQKAAETNSNYNDAINSFNGQLGMEAKAILMSYYANKS